MKKALIALLLLLVPGLAFGQGVIYASDGVSSTALVYGQKVLIAIPGASITVCSIPVTLVNGACTNKVALYSNAWLTQQIPNPTTLDANSNYSFYAANAILQYTVTNKGVSSGPFFVRVPGLGTSGTTSGTTTPPSVGGITSLDGAIQPAQTFIGSANLDVFTDLNFGTHTFSVTGLSRVATSGNWSDLNNIPAVFPPSLPTTTAPGGVFIPVSCPPVTDPLTLAAVPQHVYGIQSSSGQLLCSPDNNWDLQLQVNGVTVAAGVRAINFVGSSGMAISAANNAATGVITYTVTGSTATQAQSPSFTPLPGAYSGAQNVVLGCPSPSPTIYYTTNGVTPTHASSVYSSPVNISTGTIEAICASSGLADSNLASAVYSQTAPVAFLPTTAISFPTQLVGSPSSASSVGLSNTGTAVLAVSSLTFTGTNASSFSQTNNCSTVAVNASCTINVVFTPSGTGSMSATLNVNDNASGSPQTISLTGTGAVPLGSVTPTSILFDATSVANTSSSQLVTLSNGGTVSMTVSSVVLGGTNSFDFVKLTNNCTVVPAGGSCNVTVAFRPSVVAPRTATLTFNDNASNNPQTVALSGTGLGPVMGLSYSLPPDPGGWYKLLFPVQAPLTSSAPATVTVTNSGTSAIGFSSIFISTTVGYYGDRDFAQTNNCVSVAPGGSCTISVIFSPESAGCSAPTPGTAMATLTLSTNANGGFPTQITLGGKCAGY